MKRKTTLAVFAVALLCGIGPLAADSMVKRGIDVFTTTANGKTFYDFAQTPIPEDFFCKGSAAFSGRMTFRGLPLETTVHGQLHGADTIVERLDDATFNSSGAAVTRIQLRALSLVSIAPLKTSCGAFHVYVTLAGAQRQTKMHIYRTSESGGSFVAPLAINARLTFIPVKGARGARKLELLGSFDLPGGPTPWSHAGGPSFDAKRIASIVVDTDGDMIPDTKLAGTSNFAPGWSPDGFTSLVPKSCIQCEPETCHTDSGEQHCTGPILACNGRQCP